MKKSLKAVFLLFLTSKAIGQYSYTSPTHTFTTPYGNIQMGPLDANWAQINTDRSKFLFNKDVYSLTGFSSYTSTNLSLKTSGTTRMTILNTNGNVGIGTTNPTKKLHIEGDAYISGFLFMPYNSQFRLGDPYSSTQSGSFIIQQPGNSNTFIDINGNLFFRRANILNNLGATMGLQSDGTVTMGFWEKYDNTVENTFGHKLMVNGGILSNKLSVNDNGSAYFGKQDNSTGSMSITHNTNGNSYIDIDKGSLYFRRKTGTTNLGASLGIQNDGTVTIGVWEKSDLTVTNTDGHKLMVNGGILCERMKVIADVPNSDHVFAPTYKLRTLEEVKEYVSKYKHLPEIPSAEEFQKNGYYVGEMDDVLLRKVEELTLYLIQLKEEIEELKKTNK